MSEHIKNLINQLIQAAREQGLSQAQLAEKAGMSAVGLSKAKQRGDIRASSLQALAEVLKLELSLQPRLTPKQVRKSIMEGTFFQTTKTGTGDK